VSRERVRQIEQRALRKMQHPSVRRKLLATGFYDIFGKVNVNREQIKKFEDTQLN